MPLAEAMITLVNVDTSTTWACTARTDNSGKAVIKTNGMYDGAPAGTYKATVVKQEIDRGSNLFADAPDIRDNEQAYRDWNSANEARITAAQARLPATYDLVDPKFNNMETTTLEVTITAGKNQHTLDVGSAVRTQNRERPQ